MAEISGLGGEVATGRLSLSTNPAEIELRHNGAWDRVALGIEVPSYDDSGEVFLTRGELRDLASMASAMADRLELFER